MRGMTERGSLRNSTVSTVGQPSGPAWHDDGLRRRLFHVPPTFIVRSILNTERGPVRGHPFRKFPSHPSSCYSFPSAPVPGRYRFPGAIISVIFKIPFSSAETSCVPVACPYICAYLLEEYSRSILHNHQSETGIHQSFMALSKNTKIRILIAAALIIGWIIVVFFRSGTAWG